MRKKIIIRRALFLVLALFLSLTEGAAVEINGISYSIYYTQKTAKVTSGKNSYSGNIYIPSSITYEGDKYSVTSIGFLAFSYATKLTAVTIPNSVTTIEEGAFGNCSGLTSIIIPNSVTSIGKEAFTNCKNLTTVTIGNGVTSIGSSAFNYCTGLTSVTIGNSVTSIGSGAFSRCPGLTSVTIPSSVTSIGSSAFNYCTGLTSVTVEDGNSIYDSRDNCNAIIETATNTLISGCQTTVIPNSVTSIGDYAFNGCSGLTSIIIPKSVVSIGQFAFDGCTGLTSIGIPNSVTSIGLGAFCNCKGLTSVTIPNSVTSIGVDAFYMCSGLTSVTIPNSVTSIGKSAFNRCSSLTSITIPNSVTSIGESAFKDCTSLTSVTMANRTPITITSDPFSNRVNATLYVPYGCKALYEVADYWKEFKDIIEVETRLEQSIEMSELPEMAYGDAAYDLPSTTEEGQIITWSSSNVNVASIIGNTISIKGGGTTIITATQVGGNDYLPFSKEFTLAVTKAMLTITADDCTKQEGDPNPPLTVSYNGFKYDDNASSLYLQPMVKTTATTDSPAGTYPITVSGALSGKYEFTYVNGLMTVTAKQPIVTKGDLNGDGTVSISDVVLIIDVMAGTITDANQVAAADVNGDGSVSITDCVAAIDLIAAQAGAGSRMANVNE